MANDGLSAGAAARRLGVAVTTLRTWHQRYGLGPSRHEPGHHRRYTDGDMLRLQIMQQLTAQGVAPAEAAAWARRAPTPDAPGPETERSPDPTTTAAAFACSSGTDNPAARTSPSPGAHAPAADPSSAAMAAGRPSAPDAAVSDDEPSHRSGPPPHETEPAPTAETPDHGTERSPTARTSSRGTDRSAEWDPPAHETDGSPLPGSPAHHADGPPVLGSPARQADGSFTVDGASGETGRSLATGSPAAGTASLAVPGASAGENERSPATTGFGSSTPATGTGRSPAPGDRVAEPWLEVLALPLTGGPAGGGQNIALGPHADPAARGLARAAMRLDGPAMRHILEVAIAGRGVIATWEQVMMPVLIGVGERYEATARFIEVEHLLSRSVTESLSGVPRPPWEITPRAMLAAAAEERHTLPLEALAAALAESGVPSRLLGAQLPSQALMNAVERTGPAVVVLWAQLLSTADVAQLEQLLNLPHPPLVLAAAGPGWAGSDLPPAVTVFRSLAEAVRIVGAACR